MLGEELHTALATLHAPLREVVVRLGSLPGRPALLWAALVQALGAVEDALGFPRTVPARSSRRVRRL